ncbi:hypothetical protein AHP1_221 [Aeromonas phage Ahp1_CNU-2021]|nr:hypothetical protein AHP1_221 [Aeromonas phage Ahp1_CNU-2021]
MTAQLSNDQIEMISGRILKLDAQRNSLLIHAENVRLEMLELRKLLAENFKDDLPMEIRPLPSRMRA